MYLMGWGLHQTFSAGRLYPAAPGNPHLTRHSQQRPLPLGVRTSGEPAAQIQARYGLPCSPPSHLGLGRTRHARRRAPWIAQRPLSCFLLTRAHFKFLLACFARGRNQVRQQGLEGMGTAGSLGLITGHLSLVRSHGWGCWYPMLGSGQGWGRQQRDWGCSWFMLRFDLNGSSCVGWGVSHAPARTQSWRYLIPC